MITCTVRDESDSYSKTQPSFYGNNRALWEQEFSRVPCVGEYIIREGYWMLIHSVVWRGSGADLGVYWDGGQD
jgi:hypothetical protein